MEVWMGMALGLALGVIIGALIVYVSQKAQSGGKTVGQVQSEFKEYQKNVQEHFSKTSDLFRDMTHQYREFYDHLANGAQSLCEIAPTTVALDIAERDLLTSVQDPGDDGNGQSSSGDDGELGAAPIDAEAAAKAAQPVGERPAAGAG